MKNENNKPLLKPSQKYRYTGLTLANDPKVTPGDFVRMPTASGTIEETRRSKNNQIEFRLEGKDTWYKENHLLNHLDFQGFSWQPLYLRF